MIDILQYAVIAATIYVILDVVWMKIVAKNLYENEVGEIIRKNPNYIASVLVYAFISFGLVFFVTEPALVNGNLVYAILGGLLYGFVVSSTYALTNLAIIKNWSITLSIVDITWMSFLASISSLLTYFIFT
jgi:uncharacterized membrane protein